MSFVSPMSAPNQKESTTEQKVKIVLNIQPIVKLVLKPLANTVDIKQPNIEYLINSDGCLAFVVRQWLSNSEADTMLKSIIDRKLDFKTLPGSTAKDARRSYACGDADLKTHGFSRYSVDLNPWSTCPEVAELKNRIIKDSPGLLNIKEPVLLNSVLIQEYSSGQSGIGWHGDRESSSKYNAFVATVSLGDSRQFAFRQKNTTKIGIKTKLNHGDLCIMYGDTQKKWDHCITKQANAGLRIAPTFRHLGD